MPPTDRIRDHAGQGATTVAAHRARRRLRADQARQLADLLRRQLLTDGFPDGTLPHESTLATDYRASRNTVRQALDLLRAEGLVERLPGVGTVVVAQKYPHGLDRLMGLAETLHEHGHVTNEVRTMGPVAAPAPVADRLHVPPGADVLYIERLRRLGGIPSPWTSPTSRSTSAPTCSAPTWRTPTSSASWRPSQGNASATPRSLWRRSPRTPTPPPYWRRRAARPSSCSNASATSRTAARWTWSSSASAGTASR